MPLLPGAKATATVHGRIWINYGGQLYWMPVASRKQKIATGTTQKNRTDRYASRRERSATDRALSIGILVRLSGRVAGNAACHKRGRTTMFKTTPFKRHNRPGTPTRKAGIKEASVYAKQPFRGRRVVAMAIAFGGAPWDHIVNTGSGMDSPHGSYWVSQCFARHCATWARSQSDSKNVKPATNGSCVELQKPNACIANPSRSRNATC